MRIGFLLLAHERLDVVARLITRLTAAGDIVALHWDRGSEASAEDYLRKTLRPEALALLTFARRHKVSWGEWPMVEATFACIDAIAEAGRSVDYVVTVSGADYPIRPVRQLRQFLVESNKEFIECHRPDAGWIVRGHTEERYLYRHWGNWRSNPRRLRATIGLQQKLGLKRRLPEGLHPFVGSQWWALRWPTAVAAREMARQRRIARFFRRVAVPDEMFFQTVVANTMPAEEIAGTGPTFYMFDDDGSARTFYNDHADLLLRQDCFLARKISPDATALRDELDRASRTATGRVAFALPKAEVQDYRATAAMHRAGLPDRRIMGLVDDHWAGPLARNTRPCFALIAPPDLDVTEFRGVLNTMPGVVCFDGLFEPNRIAYGMRGHPSYPETATALRDDSAQAFLYDLMRWEGGNFVGFVLRIDHSPHMLDLAKWHPIFRPVICVPGPETQDLSSMTAWSALAQVRQDTERAGKEALTYRPDMTRAETRALAKAILEVGRNQGAVRT